MEKNPQKKVYFPVSRISYFVFWKTSFLLRFYCLLFSPVIWKKIELFFLLVFLLPCVAPGKENEDPTMDANVVVGASDCKEYHLMEDSNNNNNNGNGGGSSGGSSSASSSTCSSSSSNCSSSSSSKSSTDSELFVGAASSSVGVMEATAAATALAPPAPATATTTVVPFDSNLAPQHQNMNQLSHLQHPPMNQHHNHHQLHQFQHQPLMTNCSTLVADSSGSSSNDHYRNYNVNLVNNQQQQQYHSTSSTCNSNYLHCVSTGTAAVMCPDTNLSPGGEMNVSTQWVDCHTSEPEEEEEVSEDGYEWETELQDPWVASSNYSTLEIIHKTCVTQV